jgi:hypothetical protein
VEAFLREDLLGELEESPPDTVAVPLRANRQEGDLGGVGLWRDSSASPIGAPCASERIAGPRSAAAA